MLGNLLSRWPLIQQIKTGANGNGVESMSERTRNLRPKTDGAKVTRSICPYCGVGCGQLVFHKNGKLVSIEGDPESPISRGRPLSQRRGYAIELHTHPERLKKVKYRRPHSHAMGRTRSRNCDGHGRGSSVGIARANLPGKDGDGESLMQTTAIAHLGGATLDNEENYLIKKLFTAGLGMVCVSNQARI